MKAKFEIGQKVMFLGMEQTIKVVKKDFATGEISYRLANESLVKESELSFIEEKEKAKEIPEKELGFEEVEPEFPLNEDDEDVAPRPKIQRKK